MKVGIDISFCEPSKVGGAEQFLRDLIYGFAILEEKKRIEGLYLNDGKKVWAWLKNRFIVEYSSALKLQNCSLVIFPNYHTPIARFNGQVVTIIHDLNYLWFPSNFSLIKRVWLWISHQVSLRRADKIVVISNFVKNDMIEKYGKKWSNKISVVYNPINWDELEVRLSSSTNKDFSFLQESNYILSVSAQWRHKNLHTLIRAFAKISKNDLAIKLVLVGQLSKELPKANKTIVDLCSIVREEGLESRVVFTGYVDQQDLNMIYSQCRFFVFPSLFEGFGRPVAEALGMGIPTLCSGIESLREVSMGLAEYVDNPENVEEWVTKLDYMLTRSNDINIDDESRQAIRTRYSPESIADQYVKVAK